MRQGQVTRKGDGSGMSWASGLQGLGFRLEMELPEMSLQNRGDVFAAVRGRGAMQCGPSAVMLFAREQLPTQVGVGAALCATQGAGRPGPTENSSAGAPAPRSPVRVCGVTWLEKS